MLLNGNKILLNICKRKYFTNLTLLCYVCLKQIVFCTSTSGECPRTMKRKIKTLKLDSLKRNVGPLYCSAQFN